MNNLIAYIPVLNQRHINWFKTHPESILFLISQEMAQKLVPRLARNIVALPTDLIEKTISALNLVCTVYVLRESDDPEFLSRSNRPIFMPDEDISHAVCKEYLPMVNVSFEMIWARYDMTAVQRQSPVITDVTISQSVVDNIRMDFARKIAPQSSDWWRQVGAAAFRGNELLACAYNTHLPDEYITYVMCDPRINVDAGQPGKYTSTHAEKMIVALCARDGKALHGAVLYVTTFPCEGCSREITVAGIKKLFFEDGYSTLDAQEVLRAYDVEIVQVKKDPAG